MNMKHVSRSKIICGAVVLLVFVYMIYLVCAMFLTPESRSRYNNAKAHALASVNIEGSLVDRNGELITYSDKVGKSGECYHLSYSYLAGKFTSFGTQTGSGLRSRFAGYLYDAESEGERGATLHLTLDTGLNNHCFNLAKAYPMCSIVVMSTHTSEIYALVNYNHRVYDVNTSDGDVIAQYNEISKFWVPMYTYSEAPGSTFKVVTSSLILDKGLEEEVYYDDGRECEGEIHNYGNAAYGNVALKTAFRKSINTYFASMGMKLGPDAMMERANDFLIGETIPLDFATLTSSIDVSGGKSPLAHTSYGQGKTTISPVHIAMIGQAIANKGIMMKPYTVDCIDNELGEVLYSAEPEVLNVCVSEETAGGVKQLMREAAKAYGLPDYVHAKSGTADITENKKAYNHAYLLTFSKNYVVLVSVNETSLAGSQLASTAAEVYDYLNNYM